METFSVLLAIRAGNSLVSGEYPAQRPVTRSFDIFFDLHLNKRLSKHSWGWWFETPDCKVTVALAVLIIPSRISMRDKMNVLRSSNAFLYTYHFRPRTASKTRRILEIGYLWISNELQELQRTVWQLRRYLPSTVLSRWRKRRSVSDQFSAIVAASRERGNDWMCIWVM